MKFVDRVIGEISGLDTNYKILLGIFVYSLFTFVIGTLFSAQYQKVLSKLFSFLPADRRQRLVFEIPRKAFHLLGAITPIALQLMSHRTLKLAGVALLGFAGCFFVFEELRLHIPKLNEYFVKICKNFVRPQEVDKFTGVCPLISALGIVVCLFHRETACFAFLCLFLGDAAAALVGTAIGHIKLGPKKSLAGFLAFFGVCFWLCRVFGRHFTLVESLVCAALCAGVELCCGQWVFVDDNLLIPVVSALIFSRSVSEIREEFWNTMNVLK